MPRGRTTAVYLPNAGTPLMALKHDTSITLSCLARGKPVAPDSKSAPSEGTLLFADNYGRLLVVDTATRRLTVI